jgi:hypothetical protein
MSKPLFVSIHNSLAEKEYVKRDLHAFLRKVNLAVYEQYRAFNADSEDDIYTVEVYLDKVVVRDYKQDRFVMADMAISDDGEEISFSNQKIVRQVWSVVETMDGVSRSESDEMSIVRHSFWGILP